MQISGPARLYVYTTFSLGSAVIALSLYELQVDPVGYQWLILAALTLMSGSATVRLPSVPATLSISETFVFTAVLLFGPACGTATVALDSLVMSFWQARKTPEPLRLMFNIGAPALSVWLGAHGFFLTSGVRPLVRESSQISQIAIPLVFFACVYFLANSCLTALAISFEKHESPRAIWCSHFAWLSLNYLGGASLAALLVVYTRSVDITFVAVMFPLLLVMYSTFHTSMARVEDTNRHLAEINLLHLSTIETLAMAIDAKDQITHGHVRRVQTYATELTRALGVQEEPQVRAIAAASLLHDMGKLAVPEYILNKPGPLTPAEFEKMKRHASAGAEILSAIQFPYPVVPIVRHHHENWDGTGYPDQVKGEAIPIGARILSVVDCFDALTSDRPYRPRMPIDQAIQILVERSGTMYDPAVVDAFIRIHPTIAVMNQVVSTGLSRNALVEITTSALPGSDVEADRSTTGDNAAMTDGMLSVYGLAKSAGDHLSLSDAADIIAKHLRRMLPFSTAIFYLYEEETDTLVARHVAGHGQELLAGLTIPLGERLTGWVGAYRRTIVNSNPDLDLMDKTKTLNPTLRSCLSTPLVDNGTLVGVFSAYSLSPNAFTKDHVRIAAAVGRQIARTVLNAHRSDLRRADCLRDQVTGLPNFRHLEQLFATAASHDGLLATPVSVLLVSMEDVPTINRQVGCSAVDRTVTTVVEGVRATLRGADMLFRSAAGELVVLLSQTDSDTSRGIATRLSNGLRVEDTALGQPSPRIQIGFATAPEDGTSLSHLLRAAGDRSRVEATAGGYARPEQGQLVH